MVFYETYDLCFRRKAYGRNSLANSLSYKFPFRTHSLPGLLTNTKFSREMSRTIPSLFFDFLSLLNRTDSSFSPFWSSKKFLEYFVIKNYQKNKIWYVKSGLVIMSVFLLLTHYLSTGWHVLMDPAYMIFSMLSHLRSGSWGRKLIKLVAESLRKAF